MTSTLAYIKCHVIIYSTAKDEMCYFGISVMLSYYFPPLELVHRVEAKKPHSNIFQPKQQYVCISKTKCTETFRSMKFIWWLLRAFTKVYA